VEGGGEIKVKELERLFRGNFLLVLLQLKPTCFKSRPGLDRASENVGESEGGGEGGEKANQPL